MNDRPWRGHRSHSTPEYAKVRIRNLKHSIVVTQRRYEDAFFAHGKNSLMVAMRADKLRRDEATLAKWEAKLERMKA